MNGYDRYFDFRMATIEDTDAIMKFIEENWDKNHILANDKDFFIYFYGDPNSKLLNMYLMIQKDGRIAGINGFVKYSSEKNPSYISSAMTKVLTDLPVPMSGVEMMKHFYLEMEGSAEFSFGTNPKTILPIHKRVFKCSDGIMDQFCFIT